MWDMLEGRFPFRDFTCSVLYQCNVVDRLREDRVLGKYTKKIMEEVDFIIRALKRVTQDWWYFPDYEFIYIEHRN